MRKTWIMLVLLGIVPALGFHVLDWSGATVSLQYIAKTNWQWGAPSPLDFVMMFVCVLAWVWRSGFMNVFLFAAIPFLIHDILVTIKRRKKPINGVTT